MRFKLLIGIQQGAESFKICWSKITELADKFEKTGLNSKKAMKDMILFLTPNNKLRKKVLAKDSWLEDGLRLGLV